MQVVEFSSKSYIVQPGAGVPDGAINPADLPSKEQVELYNLVIAQSGGKRVNKFKDKATGVRRVCKALIDWEADEFAPAGQPSEPLPKKAAKPVADKRKKRGMRFVFPFNGPDHMRSVQSDDSLRGKAVALLKKGVIFIEIEDLVTTFDKERNKKSEHVERRAYELVRIMHYYLGYGVAHNQETGVIKLHTRLPGN